MRKVGNVDPYEALIYAHWLTVLQLLKLGLPWEAINNFTPQEISLILGIQSAINEVEGERMKQSSHVKGMHSQMESLPAWA